MANTLKIKRGLASGIPQGQLAEPLFTTDTYDLYIGKGSGGNQRIQNYIASGTSSQFLKGDGSLDSNTYQTALTFSSPLVNTSGTVSIPAATGSVNGYLTSTDWTTFNSKEPAITASTSTKYWRGDKTFQTLDTSVVPENGPVYFTEPRVLATVLTGLNLSGGGTIAATDSVLTAFGKIQNQISGIAGGVNYQGTWNASTNSPTLTSSVGTKGYYYVVSVAGSTNLDGITDWKVGDWAIFNGTAWDKVDNTDAVSSVNGFTGAVNLGLGDISNVTLTSPTNAQLLRFNGTSSKWENWTPTYISGNQTITLSGDVTGSGTTAITTTIGALKVTNAMLAGSIDYAKMDATTVPTWNQNTTGQAGSVANSITFNNGGAGAASGTTFNGSAARTISYNTIGAQPLLTNPVTGTGTSGQIAYFNGTSSITSSSTFTFSPTGQFIINNTAQLGVIGMDVTSNVYATANNDILYGVRINPTFLNGSYTGVTQRALGVFGNVYINGNITGAGWQGAVIGSSYGGAGTVSGILKANGSGTVSAAVAGTDYVVPSALSGYLPLTGGTLTGALSGTSATFSSSVGINGATPVAELQVGKSSDVTIAMSNSSSVTTGNRGTLAWYNSSNSSVAAIRAVAVTDNVGSDLEFYTRPAAGSLTKVLTIASTGAATFSSTISLADDLTLNSANPQIKWASGNLRFSSVAGGADRMVLTSAGAATFSSSVTANSASLKTSGALNLYVTDNSNYAYIQNSGTNSGTNNIGFYVSGASPDLFIKANGSVGIGTSSPASKLQVEGGEIRATTSNAGIAMYYTSSNGELAAYNWGAGAYLNLNLVGLSHTFQTSGTERLRITSGGNVNIGSSTAAGYGLLGSSNLSSSMGITFHNGSTYSKVGGVISVQESAGSHALALWTRSGGNEQESMRITSDGNIEATGSIKTGAPSGGTAKPWKFGNRIAATNCYLNSSQYIELEVDGTTYKLATIVIL
jgi:hypothetical protein